MYPALDRLATEVRSRAVAVPLLALTGGLAAAAAARRWADTARERGVVRGASVAAGDLLAAGRATVAVVGAEVAGVVRGVVGPATEAREAPDSGFVPAVADPAAAMGAPGAATGDADRAEDRFPAAAEAGAGIDAAELPIPDFDTKTIGHIRGRLRALSLEDLVLLRSYEQAHAGRRNVLTMLENRIAKVSAFEA